MRKSQLQYTAAAAGLLFTAQTMAGPVAAANRLVEPLPAAAASETTSPIPPVMTPAYRMRATDRPSCDPTIVPAVFGHIQNFQAATSLCNSLLAPAVETATITTTVTEGAAFADYYAGRQQFHHATTTASFPMVTRNPLKASEACTCLVGSKVQALTVTETITETATPKPTAGLSKEDQLQIAMRMQKDPKAIAAPTLDPRYGKPARHMH